MTSGTRKPGTKLKNKPVVDYTLGTKKYSGVRLVSGNN